MNTSTSSWVKELQSLVTDPALLCRMLKLSPSVALTAKRLAKQFPLRVTRSFVARMQKGNVNDPLLQQVLPIGYEEEIVSGFNEDPLQESQYNPIPGLLHKYQGRVLITVTGGCAIHCRYCFRRYFPYAQNLVGRKLEQLLDYIAKDNNISEVILSGGDPLMVHDDYLSNLLEQLASIPHLKTVRLHTRLPIVLPTRINSALIKSLLQTRLQSILVIHCNHPQEIDKTVERKLRQLAKAGILLFNQSVLLKNINDSTDVLSTLSRHLLACRVIPYYLHILDRVQGAAHFAVDKVSAKQLYYALRTKLPGYLVPLLVEERAGTAFKVPLV